MHSELKDQVFQRAGTSYLVLNRDPQAPDWLWVRVLKSERATLRMHRDEIVSSLREGGIEPTTDL